MTFELNEQDLKVIEAALQEMPLKHALPVMQKMAKQLAEQQIKPEVDAKTPGVA